jgi:hypothetical protein
MSKRLFFSILDLQFFICNVPQKGTEYYGATGRPKMCHNMPQKELKDLCAIGRHKMCHSTAQKYFLTYVPKEGTTCTTGRHKMWHRKAQNVPQHGTKILLDRKEQNVPF